jgi:hypothetical protein
VNQPTHRLFSPMNVGAATFLGTAFAGSILLALNFRRLGRKRAALLSLLAGAAATIVIVVLAVITPDGGHVQILFTGINVGLLFGMKRATEAWQGADLAAHQAAGGRVGAGWATAGVVAGCLALVAAVVFAAVLMEAARFGESIEVGKSSVYYKDGVTEAEARQVGAVLVAEGYFDDDTEGAVQVVRVGGTPHLRFIVTDAGLADELEDAFREAGRAVADQVFDGVDVVIDLTDAELAIRKSIRADR